MFKRDLSPFSVDYAALPPVALKTAIWGLYAGIANEVRSYSSRPKTILPDHMAY